MINIEQMPFSNIRFKNDSLLGCQQRIRLLLLIVFCLVKSIPHLKVNLLII